jgi:hypothetical protein
MAWLPELIHDLDNNPTARFTKRCQMRSLHTVTASITGPQSTQTLQIRRGQKSKQVRLPDVTHRNTCRGTWHESEPKTTVAAAHRHTAVTDSYDTRNMTEFRVRGGKAWHDTSVGRQTKCRGRTGQDAEISRLKNISDANM